MLFHRFQAWNLALALYEDSKMAARGKEGFVGFRLEQGFREGWLRPALSREALEMFVIDEDPLLPPDLDIDPHPIKGHLRWFGEAVPELAMRTMGRYRLPEVRALEGLILSNLQRRGIAISPAKFSENIRKLEHTPEEVRWNIGDAAVREIELEFDMASLSLEFARRHIPTYTNVPSGRLGAPSGAARPEADDLTVAKFYFQNQVQVPSPETFSAARDLRENARIQEWRKQINSWSAMLKSGTVQWAEITEEINDANGYIQGAQFPSRLIPRWTSFVTLPAAAYHTFTTHSELAHMVGLGVFAYEAFHVYADLVSHAVRAPNPLEYKWFLVSNAE
jgi:hypothetical protein